MGAAHSDENGDNENDSSEERPGPSHGSRRQNTIFRRRIRGRRNIRDIKRLHELGFETQKAYIEEKRKNERIAKRDRIFQSGIFANSNQFILDFDSIYTPTVVVHPDLVAKLKDHQKAGVKFMWDAVFESVELARSSPGIGCILAHCMGLGKTLQVVTLVHTVLTHPLLNVKKVLIICPKNTLLNWENEFKKWITPNMPAIKVFSLAQYDCLFIMVPNGQIEWIFMDPESIDLTLKSTLMTCLCDPGADLVICDEGHIVKNDLTKLSRALSLLKTKRRIILTGTPLQNNLMEYYCMIEFIRPYLLGTKEEFRNMFANPIANGQYEDSLFGDVRLMKERVHVLRTTVSACIQRYDVTTLAAYLPEKFETVLLLKLTDKQIEMYQNYLDRIVATGTMRGYKGLFADYQLLQRVWTHPYSLKLYSEDFANNNKKKLNRKDMNRHAISEDGEDDEDDEVENVFQAEGRGWVLDWWRQFVDDDDLHLPESGNKVSVLLKMIEFCGMKEEKLLIFSGSLYSLRMIEHFLTTYCSGTQYRSENSNLVESTWTLSKDYFLLTGKTPLIDRDTQSAMFNDANNKRARLYLISTKAGSLGINLTAANRVVIFDASWNPAHDVQSIFRIYRLGQTKRCFVYRLLSSGTMDEKIYERQVAKQGMSKRVVDEKQVARHYTEQELSELYTLDIDKIYNPPQIPQEDYLFQQLFEKEKDCILGCHQHDTLLQHCKNEELQEQEKEGAWKDFHSVQQDVIDNYMETGDESDLNTSADNEKMILNYDSSMFDPQDLLSALKEKNPGLDEGQYERLMDDYLLKVLSLFETSDYKEKLRNFALKRGLLNVN